MKLVDASTIARGTIMEELRRLRQENAKLREQLARVQDNLGKREPNGGAARIRQLESELELAHQSLDAILEQSQVAMLVVTRERRHDASSQPGGGGATGL